MKKRLHDFQSVDKDMLGKSKNLGQGLPVFPEDHVFGAKNLSNRGAWNSAQCINGEPNEFDLKPDPGLGKSIKPNNRNLVRKEEDRHRAFGLPSIRTDIPKRSFLSVANY